jgi:folate-binding protein YgfZ
MNTLFNLNHLGLINISGPDAKRFLQGQLTCNIEEITPLQSRLGAHCTPQGRVISLFRIFLYQDNYLLQMPHELVSIALKALQKYAVFFKVSLTDISKELPLIGYQGDALSNMPEEIDAQLSTTEWAGIHLPGRQSRYQFIGGSPVFINTQPGHINQWEALDIMQTIPAIYPETSGKFLPHELNLPQINAVSFNKGCYTGQEIIARMHYRGKLKTQLFQAKITTDLDLKRGNDTYRDNKSCGSLVDYVQIDYNTYLLLIIAQSIDKMTIDAEGKGFIHD